MTKLRRANVEAAGGRGTKTAANGVEKSKQCSTEICHSITLMSVVFAFDIVLDGQLTAADFASFVATAGVYACLLRRKNALARALERASREKSRGEWHVTRQEIVSLVRVCTLLLIWRTLAIECRAAFLADAKRFAPSPDARSNRRVVAIFKIYS